jgi:hypothetical protein
LKAFRGAENIVDYIYKTKNNCQSPASQEHSNFNFKGSYCLFESVVANAFRAKMRQNNIFRAIIVLSILIEKTF